MMNLAKEIPQRAFINAQIVQEVEKTGDWFSSIAKVIGNYGISNYQYQNPAFIISLLYCLLVVPKETWIKKHKTHIAFSKLDETKLKSLFDIIHSSSDFASDYNYNILHKLRNAIAHANFEVDENMNFVFWDEYGGKENFRCKIKAGDLLQFLSVAGAVLANLRTTT